MRTASAPAIFSRPTHLAEANSPILTERLLDGSLDLMIDSEELSGSICARYPLFTDQVLLAVPEKYLPERQYVPKPLTSADILENCHKASGTSQICLQVFEHAPFLLLRHGNDTRRCADMLCRQQSFSPDIILELDQQATAYHLACYGTPFSSGWIPFCLCARSISIIKRGST